MVDVRHRGPREGGRGTRAPLDLVFGALADPTRRAILERLSHGEASVSELAAPFPVSLMAVSKHVAVLRTAGLLVDRKEGRVRRCRLRAAPLRDAQGWIVATGAFWGERLDSLVAHLGEGDPG